mmetsp:Transcript_44121/g.122171  ORF Transcript_44121/g.122171 Transcript_44121/m.122171 type:complete len:915 (+) Transcript_44121:278-3022(+)
MALETDYEVLDTLGEGSFGKVYRARHRHSDDIVAVKQIKLGSKSWEEACKSTELSALRTLRHPFIVRLRELLRSPADGSLYYVFEFISGDLCRLMRKYAQGMDESHAADLMRQLLVGLAHVHQHNFFHRDMKPENVLYDPQTETIRIADFGEARSLRARPPFTDYVGTRWYRAPECLLRDRAYSSPVDVWAAGLIFAELLRGSPLFCGTSSIDQLYRIFQVLGPAPTDWPEYQRLAQAIRFRPAEKGCGLLRTVPRASPQAQALLGEILALNPRRRPLSRKTVDHAYFARLPPLDLEQHAARRISKASSFSAPPENRRPAPLEDERPCSSVKQGVPEEMSTTVGDDATPRAETASMEPTPSAASQPQRSLLIDDDLDLDLDEELDKILGGSPVATAKTTVGFSHEESSRLDANGEQSDPRGRSRTCPELLLSAAIGGFNDASAMPTVSSHPAEPPSPGAGSVDALLDSLCADFGVDTQQLDAAGFDASGDEREMRHSPKGQLHEATEDAIAGQFQVATEGDSDGVAGGEDEHEWPCDVATASARCCRSPEEPKCEATRSGATSRVSAWEEQTGAAQDREEEREEDQQGQRPGNGTADSKDWDSSGSDALKEAEACDAEGRRNVATFAGSSQGADQLPVSPKQPPPPVPASAWGLGDDGLRGKAPDGAALAAGGSASDVAAEPALPAEAGTPLGVKVPRPPRIGGAADAARHDGAMGPQSARVRDESRLSRHSPWCSSSEDDIGLRDRVAASLAANAPDDSRGSPAPCAASDRSGTPQDPSPNVFQEGAAADAAAAEGEDRHGVLRRSRSHSRRSWTAEESSQLRRVVKRINRRGFEKDHLWAEVSKELGAGRSAKECKRQYASEYRAHKAASAGGDAEASLPPPLPPCKSPSIDADAERGRAVQRAGSLTEPPA